MEFLALLVHIAAVDSEEVNLSAVLSAGNRHVLHREVVSGDLVRPSKEVGEVRVIREAEEEKE